jgi:carbamoyltransferase
MKPILAFYGIQDRNYQSTYPAYTHDHNLTVLDNGKIEHYLQLERWTRRKNDNRLHLFMEELLDNPIQFNRNFELVTVNSFVGNAFISEKGRLRIEATQPVNAKNGFAKAHAWFQQTNWDGFAPKSWCVSHELAHIFSHLPFYGEFQENSLLIHFDGGASNGNFSAFHYKNGQLHFLESHWELNYLSKFFNDNALSFALMKANPGQHCSVPGKLMGFAAMGNSDESLEAWLIENNYFRDIWDDKSTFYKAAFDQFGWNGDLDNLDDTFLMNIAAGFQSIFQKTILNKIQVLQTKTKTDYLYYSGGCALNITTNSKLVQSNLFKDVFIPPPCNDSGLSLGAAAFVNWQKKRPIQKHDAFLNNFQTKKAYQYTNETIRKVAEEIANGKIIGICNGFGEAGPRALGNRSIIARPDSVAIAKKVSIDCKGREWFRPIAPIILEENAKKVTGLNSIHHLSRFMLLDFKIEEQYRDKLKGVVHSNKTARIQTLFEKADNPFLFDLLTYLNDNFQIIGLINTSFNKRGEPIVQTAENALISGKHLNLDGVVINGEYQNL